MSIAADLELSTPEALAYLRKSNLGVEWYLPGARRRFATSTRATSDLIVMLGAQGLTVSGERRRPPASAGGKPRRVGVTSSTA